MGNHESIERQSVRIAVATGIPVTARRVRGGRNVTLAVKLGQNERKIMSYWTHQIQRSPPQKVKPPTISQVKDLLLEYHGIVAEAIAEITIDEEDHIHGFAEEEGEWYRFTIYKY